MIYGAYGYTGRLVAEEAVRRGHRPILAGRSEAKLAPVAKALDLDWVAVSLEEPRKLEQALAGLDLVYHAAGPFIYTSEPMVHACLATGTSYVDITGELPVFRHTFSHDQEALQQGVALISGLGFDVIPTDCLAEYVAQQVPNAVELETAIAALGQSSAGTTKTMLEMLPRGLLVRREGRLVPQSWGQGTKRVRFPHRTLTVAPIPWGDLETAFQTTGIPNITSYLALPPLLTRLMAWMAPLGARVVKILPIRRLLQKLVDKTVEGPDAETRQSQRSYVWARATDETGREAQAWLATVETYQFTVVAGVRAVEQLLARRPKGALTPALALGADFVLEIEKTRRLDSLP